MPIQKTIEERLAEVHPTVEALARVAADRWTTENLGGAWPEDDWRRAMDDGSDSAEEEWREWHRHGQKLGRELVSYNMPLTLSNLELAFKRELPGQVAVAIAK